MDWNEFTVAGRQVIEFIANYRANIRHHDVLPNVKPGFLHQVLPGEAPEHKEKFSDILRDFYQHIMPGIVHWQSPYMHAYFPALSCAESILADAISDAVNCIGFTWASCPSATELEMIVMDWLIKLLSLPHKFLHSLPHHGGGVIMGTLSEATFTCFVAARNRTLKQHCSGSTKNMYKIMDRLVAYASDQAHSSVEKVAAVILIRVQHVKSDDNFSLRGDILQKTICEDKKKGLIPFFVCATLGTTGCCSFDNLQEIGKICKHEGLWLHVDAAYAGTAFICPEFRHFMEGIEYATSFAFNPSKWMMVSFDFTALWVEDSRMLSDIFCVEPVYLSHSYQDESIDFMHWQMPLSRKFRSLKMWFVLRSYGVEGFRKHIRKSVELAKLFESAIASDNRLEIPATRHLGLTVFRIKGDDDEPTKRLLQMLNVGRVMNCIPSVLKNKYVIRYTVTATDTTAEDIRRDVTVIWGYLKLLDIKTPRCWPTHMELKSSAKMEYAMAKCPKLRSYIEDSPYAQLPDIIMSYNLGYVHVVKSEPRMYNHEGMRFRIRQKAIGNKLEIHHTTTAEGDEDNKP